MYLNVAGLILRLYLILILFGSENATTQVLVDFVYIFYHKGDGLSDIIILNTCKWLFRTR